MWCPKSMSAHRIETAKLDVFGDQDGTYTLRLFDPDTGWYVALSASTREDFAEFLDQLQEKFTATLVD